MPGTRLLSKDEIVGIVKDKKRLTGYFKQPLDKKHSCAKVISALNQANVMLRSLDELFFEGGYDPGKEIEYISRGAFRGLLPQYGARDVQQPGEAERALGNIDDSLEADLEHLHTLRIELGRGSSEAEQEFAYKLTRSLEEEISRMQADQEGDNTGFHLPQRPSNIPELPFTSQCGYTAATAAEHIKNAAFGLLMKPLKKAGYEF